MTTPKFTPGPWIIDDSGFQTGMVKGRNGQSATIAQMYGLVDSEGGDEVAEANARLIAAAPALLEALGALIEYADNGTPIQPGSLVIGFARQAIAMVKGESK